MAKIIVLVLCAVLATGCVTPLGLMAGDKEQLAALATIKDANVVCIEADVMLGANKGSLVLASIDKGITASILVDARGKCTVDLKTEK